MSTDSSSTDCCANCGVAAVDDIKLKDCSACHLVSYCSIKCQKEHRPKHKRECKQRAAELRDELLFKQPKSSHYGDCPICCLPMPLGRYDHIILDCCCTRICTGCATAGMDFERSKGRDYTCPFCRKKAGDTAEFRMDCVERRAAADEPVALFHMALEHYDEGDYGNALKYLRRGVELGDAIASYHLSIMYRKGEGVEKNHQIEIKMLEEASIGGLPDARYILGFYEAANNNHDRAVKHWIIAATQGEQQSLDALKAYYMGGLASKEDFALALRGYQTAVNAMKSQQRKAAENSLP